MSRRRNRAADAAYLAMSLAVSLYVSFVLLLQRASAMPLPMFAALCAGMLALLLLLSRRCAGIGLSASKQADKTDLRVFFAAAGFALLVFAGYLIAFFPGGVSSDTVTQLYQATGQMPLDDWHPALHTLMLRALWFILPHPAFLLGVQGLCYALAVGYAVSSMHRWRVPGWACALTALMLGANPAISNIMAFPWKDCAFAVCALTLAAQLLNVHLSRGAWLRSPVRMVGLGAMLTLCAILRHNGVALSLAAAVWLIVSLPGLRRRAAIVLACFALLFVSVKGVVYPLCGVQKSETPLDETIGLPMTILSHIYVHAPESLDEETTAFLETMADRETYAAHHAAGDWNATKWFVSSLPQDHGYTLPGVFSYALRAAAKEPTLAIEALSGLLRMPLVPVVAASWRMSPYVDAGAAPFGIERAHQPLLSRTLNWLCRLTAKPALSWLFWNPGLLMLLLMLACVCFARRRPLSCLLLPAMLIAYHLATCVMLSSPTDFRFFLPTMMCVPLALAGLAAKPDEL